MNGLRCAGLLLALGATACGGDAKDDNARPCSECEAIAAQIEQAAVEDALPSTEGICENLPMVPGVPERTEQYRTACEEYAQCTAECK